MPKDTKSLNNNKAPACESRGFVHKKEGVHFDTPSYNCSVKYDDLLGYVLIPFSLISGRMRYAPTPVRLKSRLYWGMCWFHFRSYGGD